MGVQGISYVVSDSLDDTTFLRAVGGPGELATLRRVLVLAVDEVKTARPFSTGFVTEGISPGGNISHIGRLAQIGAENLADLCDGLREKILLGEESNYSPKTIN